MAYLLLEGGEIMGISVSHSSIESYVSILCKCAATSVLLSLTGAAPFNGTSDQNLSVAYISAFILVFLVSFLLESIFLRSPSDASFSGNIVSIWRSSMDRDGLCGTKRRA